MLKMLMMTDNDGDDDDNDDGDDDDDDEGYDDGDDERDDDGDDVLTKETPLASCPHPALHCRH